MTSMVAAVSLALVGCGGGDSDSAGGADRSADGGSSDFCATIQDITAELSGLDEEYAGDDFYGEVGDLYRRLEAAAPDDLAGDFDRVIDGFEKIRDWSEDPSSEYPFSEAEDAQLEASMNRIDDAAAQDCGIDLGAGGDSATEPDIALDEVDEVDEDGVASQDGVTVTFDDGDQSGEVAFGGDLPDDFPFPLPDVYEVGSSFQFDDASGTMFSTILTVPEADFDAVATMYEEFLQAEQFEVTKTDLSSGDRQIVIISGERSDARVDVSMSIQEVANDAAGNLTFESLVSLTWEPIG
jgi:hypothetical protein